MPVLGRKCLLVTAIAVLSAAACGGCRAVTQQKDPWGITQESVRAGDALFDRVSVGMTEEDVYTILGAPNFAYDTVGHGSATWVSYLITVDFDGSWDEYNHPGKWVSRVYRNKRSDYPL